MDAWVTPAFESGAGAKPSTAKPKRGVSRSSARSGVSISASASHSRSKPAKSASGCGVVRRPKSPSYEGTWVEKYAPARQAEVAGNKKKLEVLQTWLLKSSDGASRTGRSAAPIALLAGPCGCGKTAAVRAICAESSIELQEWSNQAANTGQAANGTDGTYAWGESQLKLLESFLLRTGKYAPLGIFGDSAGAASGKRRVVLLEELPNAVYRDIPSFHALLARYRRRGGVPLVIVFSTGGIVSQRSLFPEEQLKALQIETLSFNPVPKTDVCRRLLAIADSEGVSRTCQDIAATVERISCLCDGDIRSAINMLQFNYGASESPRRVGLSLVTGHKRSDAPGKDLHINLFHALGKVLYSKRLDDCDAIPRESSPHRTLALPACLADQARASLAFNPEEVFNCSRVSGDFFVMCLHQNYLDFVRDVSVAARAADCISASDCCSGKDWESSCYLREQAYSVSIAVRGYLHARGSKQSAAATPGWKPLHKPSWYATTRKAAELAESVRDLFADSSAAAGCSTQALVTELLPYMMKTGSAATAVTSAALSGSRRSVLRDLATFKGYSGSRVSLRSNAATDVLDDRDDGADVAAVESDAAALSEALPSQQVHLSSGGTTPAMRNDAATADGPSVTDDMWCAEEDLSDWDLSDSADDASPPCVPASAASTSADASSDGDDHYVIDEFDD